jgi:hypothetical protein
MQRDPIAAEREIRKLLGEWEWYVAGNWSRVEQSSVE